MHTNETKNQFIELRANGLSFDAIAEKINVSKSTLLRWHRDHDAEIRSLRAIQLDALYDDIFLPHKAGAECLARLQARIEHELAQRNITLLRTSDLIKAAALVRKDIRMLRKQTVQPLLAKPPTTVAPAALPPEPETPPTNPPAQ